MHFFRPQAWQGLSDFNVKKLYQVCSLLKSKFYHLFPLRRRCNSERSDELSVSIVCRLGLFIISDQLKFIPCMSFQEKMDQLELSQPINIKTLRPLIFNFFISDRPEENPQTLKDEDPGYRSFHSQRLEHTNNLYFRPTINCKKLNEEPKFRLSVEKKRSKGFSGAVQKASSERPSRNSYRGSKVKTIGVNKAILNQEDLEPMEQSSKKQKAESSQSPKRSARKIRQPHLHFNLNYLIKTSKNFTGHFSREQNIQGSNFVYYNYFSSQKSSIPRTQKSLRSKMEKTTENHRYISTTVGVREFSCNI